MAESYYSVGQAARLLGVSQYMVRRLIEAGAIEAESTPGGGQRIPAAEFDRVQRDGLPVVARAMPIEDRSRHGSNGARRLLAAPSATVADSAEKALESEYQLTVTRNQNEHFRLETSAPKSATNS